MRFRFIHAADLHLGSPFKGLKQVPGELKPMIINSTFQAFRGMIQYAIEQDVDFIVLAGDIFDQSHRSIQAQLQFKAEMERLFQAQIMCYIVHGNHDPLDGDFIDINLPENVIVFPAYHVSKEVFVKEGAEVAHIYGISYETAKVTRSLAAEFVREDQHVFSLGVLHTNCDGAHDHESYAPCTKLELIELGMDYWALGHVHQRKVLHRQPLIVYPGNLQGRHIREQGEKGFYVVEVYDQQQAELTFQPMHAFIWLESELDLTDVETVDDVLSRIEQLKERVSQEYSGQAVLLRIKGTGTTNLAYSLLQEEFTQSLVEHTYHHNRVASGNQHQVWLESLTFAGGVAEHRAELAQAKGMFQDITLLVDQLLHIESGSEQEQQWIDMNRELWEHYRVRPFLEPLTLEEKKTVIRQAETLLLGQWLGGDQR